MRRCAFEGKTIDEADAGSTCIRTWRALNTAERGYNQQYATAAPAVHVRLH